MKKIYLLFILFCATEAFAQTEVLFYTTMGDFRVKLKEEFMPITAGNFIKLVDSGYYDGIIFHRVVKGFVIQGGDPTGTGMGGPGWTIQDEYHPALNHDSAGVIAMAKTSAPNSAGSQFYFTLAPQKSLDGKYAVFGTTVEGLDVIMAIGNVPVNGQKPITDVIMDSVRIAKERKYAGADAPKNQVKVEAYPNPFSEQVNIAFDNEQKGMVMAQVFNSQGQVVETLVNAQLDKGIHNLNWTGTSLSKGIYYLQITTPTGSKMMQLVKE